MIKAVIIDFDDTLCLSEAACFVLENEVLRMMGATLQTHAIHKKTWGQPLHEAIKVRSPGVNAAVFIQLVEENIPRWASEGRMDHLPPDRLAVLDELMHQQGKQLYILTSRTFGEAKHLLQPNHDLATHIKAFYWREKMQFHKPDPRAFDLLLQEHNLQPAQCVYVGDSPSDAAAAKRAGLHFVASLESGIRTKADFKDYAVDMFIYHLQDLPKILQTLK
ncbi:MAG TPA: HAD family hydrolase [Candidatus Saccharimonadales bacterium]|nr:HAD family hydrolase [Candidatus Saccharimonadales bacterium]